MAARATTQEQRHTQPAPPEAAQALAKEENGYPGLEGFTHQMFSETIFGAAKNTGKKSLVLQRFALDRWIAIRSDDPNEYLALVVQPASELGVNRFLLEEAMAH